MSEPVDLFLYRIYCETEGVFVEGWYPTDPGVCPNNNTHTIDSTRTTILDERLVKAPTDRSGKPRVQQTSRKLGTTTCWTGAGDNVNNVFDIGSGERFIIDHRIGNEDASVYLDFNIVENETFLHEGYITWVDAQLDELSVEVVSRATEHAVGSETGFSLYGTSIIPTLTAQKIQAQFEGVGGVGTAPGLSLIDQVVLTKLIDGKIGPNDGIIYVPIGDLGYRQAQAFWNAEWDTIEKVYKNITPAPAGDGEYNFFITECVFAKLINRITLIGSSPLLPLNSSDTEALGQGMRLKMTAITNKNPDHDWCAAAVICLHRNNICPQ